MNDYLRTNLKPCIVTRGTMVQHASALPGYDYCLNHLPPSLQSKRHEAYVQKIKDDAVADYIETQSKLQLLQRVQEVPSQPNKEV